MANIMAGKFFRVFIASPSDLSDERRAVRRVVDRINQTLAGGKLDWRVELLAWEDTLPGYARPQEIINQDVDVCNLFIGLLWKRWGQSTGKYSSGFEEEFYRARDRRLTSEEPEIWMFLKAVEQDHLEDPGEQLQKTLSFRKWLQESREVLYKEFSSTDEWEIMFHDLLLQHILKNSSANLASQILESGPKPPSSGQSPDVTSLNQGSVTNIVPEELDKAIEKMRVAVTDNGLIKKNDIARLYLASFSWMSFFTTEALALQRRFILLRHVDYYYDVLRRGRLVDDAWCLLRWCLRWEQ